MASYVGTARTQTATRNNSITSHETVDRKRLTKIIVIALLAIFVLVGLQAYTATLQHANNVIAEENEYLQAEIDSMQAEIVEETKVTKIEKTARKKYGMVYPTSDNCVTIHEGDDTADNLAATIKSEAYN